MACFAAYPNLENKSQKCAKSRDLWKNQESLGCTRSISCSLVGKSSEVSAMFVNLARNALFLFFAASKSSYHEYYMLLLLEGRFEGSSLKLKHPSRETILLCWSPFAQEPQNLFVVFFWSHQAMLIGWSACFQIFAASLLFISASARTDLDLDTVTPASVFDNGFGNQCDMISLHCSLPIRLGLPRSHLIIFFFGKIHMEGRYVALCTSYLALLLHFSLSSEGSSWDIFNTLWRTLSSCLLRSLQSSKDMDCECHPMWM